jgi:hypothetical protein
LPFKGHTIYKNALAPDPKHMQPRNLNTTYFFDLEGFEHTSARKLEGLIQTMRPR